MFRPITARRCLVRPHSGRPAITHTEPDPTGYDIVDQSAHPLVQGFADLWTAKRGQRPLPYRSDFPIEELAPWFGHVIIMDVIDDGLDFRYRLIGTGITEFLDRDYSGKRVSECDYGDGFDGRNKVIDTFRRPIVSGVPVFRSGHVIWAADKTWRKYDSVHCPLVRDGGKPDLTIGVLYFGSVVIPRLPD